MKMRCLYCDRESNKYPLKNLISEDLLCSECRNKLNGHLRIKKVAGIKVYYLYDYEPFFAEVLLQYKEAYDEALKDIFLYPYEDLLYFMFRHHRIVYVPSTSVKTEERGFLPMAKIMENKPYLKYGQIMMKRPLIQAGKSKKERQLMKENYYYPGKIDKDDRILIVDDVLTSGSSILGVYDLFKDRCRDIKVFVLACVSPRG